VVSKTRKSRGVAAGSSETVYESGANWIGNDRKHDRDGPCRLEHWPRRCVAGRHDDIRSQRNQLLCISTISVGTTSGPADIDPNVTAIGPAQLLQSSDECIHEGRIFGIVCRGGK